MSRIIIQRVANSVYVPRASALRKWAKAVLLMEEKKVGEIVIRIIDELEMIELNTTYRHKKYPTNVLSFPLLAPDDLPFALATLGDIAICASVVNQEAIEQNKTPVAHWAHMVIHGVFHLLGYDHETDEEAHEMETLEIEVLATLGFANPYEQKIIHHD